MSGGAADLVGQEAAAVKRGAIRCVRAELLGLDRQRVAVITMVAGDELPEIVMFNGDPYLRDEGFLGTAYRQVRPYRADVGE